MKNNDAALIFFGQFESERMVPVCRALPDPDHGIKVCMIFSNMSKVGVKKQIRIMPGAIHTLGRPHITFRNCGIFC
jgi:hypothetical protein